METLSQFGKGTKVVGSKGLALQHREVDFDLIQPTGHSDLILALLYSIMAGLRRINKIEILQYNGTFLSLLGLARFPDQSTLGRFLKQLPIQAIRQLVALHG